MTQKERSRKWYLAHRDEVLERSREYQRKHPDRRKRYSKANKLKQYGLTLEQFEGMVAAQAGACGCCRRRPEGKGFKGVLHIDHDHITGKVRKLLCFNCNLMLGNAQDNPSVLMSGVEYLHSFKE